MTIKKQLFVAAVLTIIIEALLFFVGGSLQKPQCASAEAGVIFQCPSGYELILPIVLMTTIPLFAVIFFVVWVIAHLKKAGDSAVNIQSGSQIQEPQSVTKKLTYSHYVFFVILIIDILISWIWVRKGFEKLFLLVFLLAVCQFFLLFSSFRWCRILQQGRAFSIWRTAFTVFMGSIVIAVTFFVSYQSIHIALILKNAPDKNAMELELQQANYCATAEDCVPAPVPQGRNTLCELGILRGSEYVNKLEVARLKGMLKQFNEKRAWTTGNRVWNRVSLIICDIRAEPKACRLSPVQCVKNRCIVECAGARQNNDNEGIDTNLPPPPPNGEVKIKAGVPYLLVDGETAILLDQSLTDNKGRAKVVRGDFTLDILPRTKIANKGYIFTISPPFGCDTDSKIVGDVGVSFVNSCIMSIVTEKSFPQAVYPEALEGTMDFPLHPPVWYARQASELKTIVGNNGKHFVSMRVMHASLEKVENVTDVFRSRATVQIITNFGMKELTLYSGEEKKIIVGPDQISVTSRLFDESRAEDSNSAFVRFTIQTSSATSRQDELIVSPPVQDNAPVVPQSDQPPTEPPLTLKDSVFNLALSELDKKGT